MWLRLTPTGEKSAGVTAPRAFLVPANPAAAFHYRGRWLGTEFWVVLARVTQLLDENPQFNAVVEEKVIGVGGDWVEAGGKPESGKLVQYRESGFEMAGWGAVQGSV